MEETCDVVVVGAGGAGMAAALTAAHHGLDTVLIEKSAYFGGSTARSGGGVWIPGNRALRDAGQVDADDAEESRRYLDAIVGDVVPKERRDTFLERGPEVMDFLLEKTPVQFAWVPEYSDYLPEQPGGRPLGRTVEPVPMDGRIIGAELERLHPAYTKAPANLIVTQADFRKISLGPLRTLKGTTTMLRVLFNRMISQFRGRRMYAMGNALSISLRKALMDAGVPIHYETPLTGLVVENGRVVGVRAERDGAEIVIRARRGVILGSGGFEKNDSLREKYLPAPTDAAWSTAAASNTGAGIEAGVAIGAATDLMDDAWWGPTIPLPSGPWFCLAERNLPGSIIVNSAGKRFMNEALPYVEATHAIYAGEATGVPHVPAWMVIDQRYRNRYLFAGLSPRQPFPGRWYKSGTVRRADTLGGLAAKIGVPADALLETVIRFNQFAVSGIDEDFHRGESAYDRYYADPKVKPNPSLRSIDKGPFYAVKIVPGDLGTKGGIVTDERARALRPDGSVIEGLYAAGNCSSAVMGHTYAGPGATIGPAMTFGYLAAEDIAKGPRTAQKTAQPDADRSQRRDRGRGRHPGVRLDEQRRAALPPRRRRGFTTGRQPLPRRPAVDARQLGRRRRSASAPELRSGGADVPCHQPAKPRPARVRHQPGPGRARRPGGPGQRLAAVVRLGPVDDPHHRRLGQGQGRRDLAGGRGHRPGRHRAVARPVLDLRQG